MPVNFNTNVRKGRMIVFTSTSFVGVWPVGTAAIIVADNKSQAEMLLRKELRRRRLKQPKDLTLDLEEVPTHDERVLVLLDGEY